MSIKKENNDIHKSSYVQIRCHFKKIQLRDLDLDVFNFSPYKASSNNWNVNDLIIYLPRVIISLAASLSYKVYRETEQTEAERVLLCSFVLPARYHRRQRAWGNS